MPVGQDANRAKPGTTGRRGGVCALLALTVAVVLAGCAPPPLMPYSADTAPLVLLPAAQAGVQDQRGRFREIFCAVLEAHKDDLPDHRSCDEALTRVGAEPAGSGKPVSLAASSRKLVAAFVPGFGWDCIDTWLEAPGNAATHLRAQGYELLQLRVEGLSSSARNGELIRDALMSRPAEPGPPRLVLIGYSKGAPDILEALATYPELRSRVAAVVSASGSVGGSPLANDAEQYEADLLRHFPGATCTSGDGGAVASLRPAVRQAWLAAHPLPKEVRYYSLATFPQPERISALLKGSHDKLAQVDARNDSQMIFYNQIIPGSTLLGFVNADHWALAVPIARKERTLVTLFVDQNAYPREALAEAVLRFVEEDLAQTR
jgi:pimeloyl-ACP methyl ester carboxylesterase